MGFYGNITSTNKTQFTFDAIYSSRAAMEDALNNKRPDGLILGDGVFVGRFVLVDYEDGTYFPIYKKDDSGIFYADSSFKIIMTTELCEKGNVFQYQAGATRILYKATGEVATTTVDGTEITYATFDPVSEKETYIVNYNEDIKRFGPGRGYDGTVWQKTFTNGEEKYVMIAELNSVVPTFKVTADAPTMEPLPPHFDKQSNNVAYWLHVQPQWGMRVQEAPDLVDKDGNPILDKDGKPIKRSDVKVTWLTNPFNAATQELQEPKEEKIQGNIFFNKAGLSKEKKSFVSLAEGDIITVTPTGVSGVKYNAGHNGDWAEAPDIQEISIVLPSIGNTISEAWDVVYGEPADEDGKRNLDIDWDSIKGVRMVEEDSTGYRYNTENMKSLAGCINSVHDLMGMVIMGKSPEDAKDADNVSIYFDSENENNKTYQRKHTTYEYIDISDTTQMTEKGIEKDPKLSVYYEPKEEGLLLYEPNKYYLKDSLNNYLRDDNNEPDESRNYYTVSAKPQSLEEKYLENKWWYKDGGNNYIKAIEKEAVENRQYLIPTFEKETIYWYKPGAYFYSTSAPEEENNALSVDIIWTRKLKAGNAEDFEDVPYNKNYTYWYIPGVDISTWKVGTSTTTDPVTGITTTAINIPWDKYGVGIDKLRVIKLSPFTNDKDDDTKNYYTKEKEDYKVVTVDPSKNENSGDYYLLKKKVNINPFYQPDTYHFESENGYLADRYGKFDKDKKYFIVTENKIEEEFFIIGKYYEKLQVEETYEFEKTKDTSPIAEKTYYEQRKVYVTNDESKELPYAFEWNPNCKIPNDENLTFSIRKEKYVMQELEGFARTYNTIHGLILEIRKLLDAGHADTRDDNTVQGVINKLNDIIVKFEDLQPGKLILTDGYGRVHPTDTIENNWIKWNIDPNPVNPSIEAIHNVAQDAVTTVSQGNKNPKFGETITTPKIAIDANGHVSSVENEDIALPKPSLTTNGSGVLTSASLVEETGALTANYTALTDVKLDGYGKTTATGDILATDSLEIGLSKLENAIAFTNDALEEVDAQLREDFAAEDAAIRSEFAAVDTAIRTEFAAADIVLQNNIDNVNTSLGNRIAVFEQGDSSTIGGVITQVNNLEQKTNARFDAVEQTVSNHAQETNGQIENINNILNQKVACSVRGLGESLAGPGTGYVVMFAENWLVNTNNAFTKESGSDIVCPYTGIILVSGSIYFNSTTESSRGVYIMKNGEEIISSYGHVYRQQGAVSSGTIIVPVNAGDKISLRARSTIEIPIIGDNAGTNLSIMYL